MSAGQSKTGHPVIVYRVVDVIPPDGHSFADYSVDELTERFADIFADEADATADYYLGGDCSAPGGRV
jgi:hypothetical protein